MIRRQFLKLIGLAPTAPFIQDDITTYFTLHIEDFRGQIDLMRYQVNVAGRDRPGGGKPPKKIVQFIQLTIEKLRQLFYIGEENA